MTGSRSRALLWALLAMLGVPAGLHAEVRVRAELDPVTLAQDATTRLTVLVEGEEAGDTAPPALSGLEGWSIVQGPSIATQVRIVQGVTTRSRSFSWVLAPMRVGRLVIPALTLETGGGRLRTTPIEATVGAGRPGAGGSPPGDDVFIRAVAAPSLAWMGQQINLRYDLFARRDVTSLPQPQELPNYPGFWVEEVDLPRTVAPRTEVHDGREWRAYTIRRLALFGSIAGESILEPLTFAVPVRGEASRAFRIGFLFDPVETLYRRSPSVRLAVRPLPDKGRPPDFSGAVGRFAMKVTAGATEAALGAGVEIKVEVEGDGSLDPVQPPAPAPDPAFTMYEPKESRALRTGDDGRLIARGVWDYVVVPKLVGERPLPAVRFSYFDPVAGGYRTIDGPSLPLHVTGSAEAADTAAGHGAVSTPTTTPDFRPLPKPIAGETPLARRWWVWAGGAAPPLLLLATWGGSGWRRRFEAGRGERRRRRAPRVARRRLREAEKGRDPQRAAAAVSSALLDFVAARDGGSIMGLTYDGLSDRLRGHGVTETDAMALADLLRRCDESRFAPEQAARGLDAGDLVRRAQGLLHRLTAMED